MKTPKLIFAVAALALGSFFAFKPVGADPAGAIRGMIEDHYALGAKTEIFRINGTKKQEILGIQGTQVDFEANSFMYESGEAHNCGSIYIKMREYCNKATLAESGLTTHSDQRMLESGGTIHIEAWCANRKLLLRPGKKIKLHFPKKKNQDASGMQLFAGREDKNGLVNWLPVSSDGAMGTLDRVSNGFIINNIAKEAVYEEDNEERYSEGDSERYQPTIQQLQADSLDRISMESSNLNWINCDRFYDSPAEKVELFVRTNTTDANMRTRLIFKDISCVMPGYASNSNVEFRFQNIPKGSKAFLLSFYRIGQQVAYAMREITIGDNKTEIMDLKLISLDQFRQKMEGLNTTP
ncbi:MAG: hypothetical protein ACRCYO_04920 [Bacteroidia bacterium]